MPKSCPPESIVAAAIMRDFMGYLPTYDENTAAIIKQQSYRLQWVNSRINEYGVFEKLPDKENVPNGYTIYENTVRSECWDDSVDFDPVDFDPMKVPLTYR